MDKMLIEGEDFYREGASVVFTEGYHRRRGYCCESGCRHCPYQSKKEGRDLDANAETADEEAA